MRNIRKCQVKAAIGDRSGDYLELHCKFACVTIAHLDEEAPGTYNVTGDTLHGDKGFTDVSEALAYALNSLAAYVDGRAD